MLTQRMREARDYIDHYIRAHGGVSPSFEEIKTGLGLASKGRVHMLVENLVERGYLRRRGCHRGLEVIRPRPPLTYPHAAYFVVERRDERAVLVPLRPANHVG